MKIKMLKDSELKIGMECIARFTNSHNQLDFKGKIIKINEMSARVESLENDVNGWPKGKSFVLPLEFNQIHSVNNGLFKEG